MMYKNTKCNYSIFLSFSSYVNWQAIGNLIDYGEGAGLDVECLGLGGSQAVAT